MCASRWTSNWRHNHKKTLKTREDISQNLSQPSARRYASLAGRNAIVTGGGRGLGPVMALALIGQGANVMITGARATGDLSEVEAEAEGSGGRCISMVADVSEPDACERVVQATAAEFGSVDIVVNNAARGPVEQYNAVGLQAQTALGLPTNTQ